MEELISLSLDGCRIFGFPVSSDHWRQTISMWDTVERFGFTERTGNWRDQWKSVCGKDCSVFWELFCRQRRCVDWSFRASGCAVNCCFVCSSIKWVNMGDPVASGLSVTGQNSPTLVVYLLFSPPPPPEKQVLIISPVRQTFYSKVQIKTFCHPMSAPTLQFMLAL